MPKISVRLSEKQYNWLKSNNTTITGLIKKEMELTQVVDSLAGDIKSITKPITDPIIEKQIEDGLNVARDMLEELSSSIVQ